MSKGLSRENLWAICNNTIINEQDDFVEQIASGNLAEQCQVLIDKGLLSEAQCESEAPLSDEEVEEIGLLMFDIDPRTHIYCRLIRLKADLEDA